LTVEIEAPLSISPAAVNLGQIAVGGEAVRKVVLRGAQDFRVTEVVGTDDSLTVTDSTNDSKQTHVLTVKFKPSKVGPWSRVLRVKTDLKEEGEIEFQAGASVIEAPAKSTTTSAKAKN